jgi:hypothetical protein
LSSAPFFKHNFHTRCSWKKIATADDYLSVTVFCGIKMPAKDECTVPPSLFSRGRAATELPLK